MLKGKRGEAGGGLGKEEERGREGRGREGERGEVSDPISFVVKKPHASKYMTCLVRVLVVFFDTLMTVLAPVSQPAFVP